MVIVACYIFMFSKINYFPIFVTLSLNGSGLAQRTHHLGHSLDEEEWFHGVLPRDEVQRLLVNDGDFLVRASKNRKTDETQYVLSVMWSTYKHFIIQECEVFKLFHDRFNFIC